MGTEILHDIEQARSGNTTAFERIVRRYQSLISGILYSMTGDFHRSEDLAQETFLIAWNKLGELKNTDDIAPWLCTIARNLACRAARKKTETTSEPAEIFEEKASEEPEPDRELQRQEQSELIWSAIGEIPETYRETLILYYRSGQSVKEIASATDSSIDAVNQRLVRARRSLKSKLEEIVGEILTETAPGDAFTFSVISAITAGVAISTAQTALAATGVTTATTATGAAAGTATGGKAVGFASLLAIIGPIAYLLWMFSFIFLAQWTSVRNAPTLHARRFRLYRIFWTIKVTIPGVFIGTILLTPLFMWMQNMLGRSGIQNTSPIMFLCSFFTVWSICFPSTLHYRKRYKKLVESDLGLSAVQSKSYSFHSVQRGLYQAILVNLFLCQTLAAALLILPTMDGESGWGMLAALSVGTVSGILLYGYFLFGKYLLEICRGPEKLLSEPPLVDKPFETALGRTGVADVSISETKINEIKKGRGIVKGLALFLYVGIVLMGAWYLSYFDWNHRALEKGICVAIFGLGLLIDNRFFKKFKTRKQILIYRTISVILSYSAFLFLMYLEYGRVSVFMLWEQMLNAEPRDSFPMMNLFLMVFGFLGICVNCLRLIQLNNRSFQRKEDDYDERLQNAIAHYRPEIIAEEAAEKANDLPFPKFWLKILGVYGILILTVFLLLTLFPPMFVQKNILRRNGNFTTLIELEPNNPQWYYQRGCMERVPEKAVEDLNTALRFKPDYSEAYLARARAYNNLGQKERKSSVELSENAKNYYLKALNDCDEAIRLEPDWIESWSVRAAIHTNLGEKRAAIDDYTHAISLLTPENRKYYSTYFFARGHLYEELGETQKALADRNESERLEKLDKKASPFR